MKLVHLAKRILACSPFKYSERLDAIVRLTLLRPWVRAQQPHPYFPTREELYAHVAGDIVGQQPISYLEFGVWQGESMRTWLQLSNSPESTFVGFDSFEGLPEPWVLISGKTQDGAFSTNGKTPDIRDERLHFKKGWFRDTLPAFLEEFSTDNQLVLHCDADIYPSTLYVLCKMDAHIRSGAIILFDDFCSMMNDFRALADYTRSFGREYEVLGAAGSAHYQHVAIRITA